MQYEPTHVALTYSAHAILGMECHSSRGRSREARVSGRARARLSWVASQALLVHVLEVIVYKVGLISGFLGRNFLSLVALTSCPRSNPEVAPPLARVCPVVLGSYGFYSSYFSSLRPSYLHRPKSMPSPPSLLCCYDLTVTTSLTSSPLSTLLHHHPAPFKLSPPYPSL
jgi:hypothetical protein